MRPVLSRKEILPGDVPGFRLRRGLGRVLWRRRQSSHRRPTSRWRPLQPVPALWIPRRSRAPSGGHPRCSRSTDRRGRERRPALNPVSMTRTSLSRDRTASPRFVGYTMRAPSSETATCGISPPLNSGALSSGASSKRATGSAASGGRPIVPMMARAMTTTVAAIARALRPRVGT